MFHTDYYILLLLTWLSFPVTAVYLTAQYARYEMRRMEGVQKLFIVEYICTFFTIKQCNLLIGQINDTPGAS